MAVNDGRLLVSSLVREEHNNQRSVTKINQQVQQVLKVLQLSITKKLKHTTQTAAMASDKSGNKTSSLTDIWRVLTEIKTKIWRS